MLLGFDSTVSNTQTVQTTQIIVFVVMVGVVLLIGLGIFVPILWFTENSSDTIMLQFVALPPPVRKSMYAQAVGRVRLLRRNYSEDDDDEEDDSELDEAEEAGGAPAPLRLQDGAAAGPYGAYGGETQQPDASAAAAGAAAAAAIGGRTTSGAGPTHMASAAGGGDAASATGLSVNWDSVLGGAGSPGTARGMAIARAAVSGHFSQRTASHHGARGGDEGASSDAGSEAGSVSSGGRWRRRSMRIRTSSTGAGASRDYRKSGRSFAMLLVRFLAPLACLVIMFTSVFAVFITTLSAALTLTSVTSAANMRAACARQAMIDLRKLSFLVTGEAPPFSPSPSLRKACIPVLTPLRTFLLPPMR